MYGDVLKNQQLVEQQFIFTKFVIPQKFSYLQTKFLITEVEGEFVLMNLNNQIMIPVVDAEIILRDANGDLVASPVEGQLVFVDFEPIVNEPVALVPCEQVK